MRKYISVTLVVAILAAFLTGCVTPGRPDMTDMPAVTNLPAADISGAGTLPVKPIAYKAVDSLKPAVNAALREFSIDLFKRLAAEDSDKNIMVSPVSVWLALGMTLSGASGDTAKGMSAALHAAGISLDDLNRDSAGLIGVLTAADPDVRLALANSVWIRASFEPAVDKGFIERVKQYYASGIQTLDFNNPSAADTISKWVEDNTNGNIQKMVSPPIDPDTVMFLINAIHFKAPWKAAFDPDKTRDGVFIASDGVGMQAKFMSREKGNAGYFDETLAAVRLPYASGRFEMVAVMPTEQTLPGFIAGLTAERLDEIAGKCKDASMPLLFPMFKAEYETELNEVLKAMGMTDAFSLTKADFSAMSREKGKELVISKIKHKSFIEVNEAGTEASAATSVEIEEKGLAKTLEFNNPFVYWIRDTKTGAVLFIGVMERPD